MLEFGHWGIEEEGGTMNRMLIAVFRETIAAPEGGDVLDSFVCDDAFTLDGYAILTKEDDGTYIVNDLRGLTMLPEFHWVSNMMAA
jgi:hypothetical protein